MTTKKNKSAARTKTGALDKKAVVEAIKNVSTTRNNETTTKNTPVVCRDSMSGKFVPSETDFKKNKEPTAFSKSRNKSGELKRTIVKDAIESISKSRKTKYEKND